MAVVSYTVFVQQNFKTQYISCLLQWHVLCLGILMHWKKNLLNMNLICQPQKGLPSFQQSLDTLTL